MNTIRVAKFLPRSEANGPGVRSVIWVQGCTLGCVGCINPWSWDKNSSAAKDMTAAEILDLVLHDVEGISISGGEPFQQPKGLALLLAAAKARRLSTLVFTGYSLWEIDDSSREESAEVTLAKRVALNNIDILVAGRYVQSQRRQDLPLIGSSNQTVHFLTDRYTEADLSRVAATEMIFDEDNGTRVKTGITK